ncbi:MAG: N-formylglutamate amidohydrolase [Alphaproteobacteria bacterium]|nr:N-formylglutamate amidohydrolase [Alphaproteobacteria bacterium]
MPHAELEPGDRGSFSLLNADGDGPAVIVCEHASHFIPEAYANLGLDGEAPTSHVAWDPGANLVAERLSTLFNAPYVRGEVSRLIYDCNRPPEATSAMPARSELFDIPGNAGLDQAERDRRTRTVYEPFKGGVEEVMAAAGPDAALVTIHSFVPIYHGKPRAVELGILHDADTRLADAMLAAAPRHTTMNTLRNEPYGPEDGVTHTLKLHGLSNGVPNVMIEIRNDLVATPEACKQVAEMLHGLISEALAEVQSA